MLIDKALKELGLSEKETKVYLAALELGPQPVQEIAKKAGVNRATTYVMIESLAKRGLMSSHDKGKKKFFCAEEPDRLLNIVKSEREEINQKEDVITKILPELMALSAMSEERPRVRYFEGSEGSRDILRDMLDTKPKEICSIVNVDEYRTLYTEYDFAEEKKEMRDRRMKIREIVISEHKAEELNLPPHSEHLRFELVSKDKFDFTGEVNVYDNKVAFSAYQGKLMSVIIDGPAINKTIQSIFDLLWEYFREYKIK